MEVKDPNNVLETNISFNIEGNDENSRSYNRSLEKHVNNVCIKVEKDVKTPMDNFVLCKEDEHTVKLFEVNGYVIGKNYYGMVYPEVHLDEGKVLSSYDKDKDEVFGSIPSAKETKNYIQVIKYVLEIIRSLNKIVYMYISQSRFILNEKAVNNLYDIISNHTIGVLEGCFKNIGYNFVLNNIGNNDFILKNMKKLSSSISIPQKVLDFIKDKPDLYDSFKIICNHDPNEGIYILDWYDVWDNNFLPTRIKIYFDDFVKKVAKIKLKNDKIKMYDLIPYLVKQNIIENAKNTYNTDFFYKYKKYSFNVPVGTASDYIDYLNMCPNGELYPSDLKRAHDIASRNSQIIKNAQVVAKFAEVVKKLKPLEYSDKNFMVVVPKCAQDLVDEGTKLHHCVATYVPIVAQGLSNVVFIRKCSNPDESFITVELNGDNIVQVKEDYNQDVDDPEVLKFISKWKSTKVKGE